MALQIESLIEEIKLSAGEYNASHGIFSEDAEVELNPDYIDFQDITEAELMEMPLERKTLELIEDIEDREAYLFSLIGE